MIAQTCRDHVGQLRRQGQSPVRHFHVSSVIIQNPSLATIGIQPNQPGALVQMPVAQSDRHVPTGLHRQDTRQAFDFSQRTKIDGFDKTDRRIICIGAVESLLQHLVNRIKGKQGADQKALRRGHADNRDSGPDRPTRDVAQDHPCGLVQFEETEHALNQPLAVHGRWCG